MNASLKLKIIAGVIAAFTSSASAESWPSLEAYVARCVLIIEAEHVGPLKSETESLTFRVIESWKGNFAPKLFRHITEEGYIEATQGQHGVRITEERQRIVFFYTLHNQIDPKLSSHSTAFPIVEGKLTYASTGLPGEAPHFTPEEFKKKITEIILEAKK